MELNIDPAKIRNRYALATVLLLVFESLFVLWFKSAGSWQERVAAGLLAAIALLAFFYMIFLSRSTAILDPSAKKLQGKWQFESNSQGGHAGTGTSSIAVAGSNVMISGILFEAGEQVGTFSSEVVRVHENRVVFYYVLRDTKKGENMDAVSILIFNPDDPNELNGDWIVASKIPRHGSVKYTRVSR